MKTIDLIDALGALDDETVLSAREGSAKTGSLLRRVPRAVLIAAVLAVLLSAGVFAYALTHPNSLRLMEAGPLSNGSQTVGIDDTAAAVIEAQSVDYGLSVTDNGVTVTLESLMGYSAEAESRLFLTFTVTPPAGTELPEDISQYDFVNQFISFPFDVQEETSWEIPCCGSSSVAVKNSDGSLSLMQVQMFGGPVEGAPLVLTLENFDLSGKAAAEDAFARQHQEKVSGVPAEDPAPLLEGLWQFDLGRIHLPAQQDRALDRAALSAAGLPYASLELTAFGGWITADDTAPSTLERLRTEYPADLRELMPDCDWDGMTEEAFRSLMEEAQALTDDSDSRAWLPIMLGWLEPWDYGCPQSLTLEYPDGTSCTVEGPTQLWQTVEGNGTVSFTFLFPAPQPIGQASAILVDGTRIPLR